MSGVMLLGNGTVVSEPITTPARDPVVIPAGAVVWKEGRIVALGAERSLASTFPEAEYLDAHGGLILPGLVNLHHHFYSALARGLDPGVPMHSFPEVLDRLWWRLDRALDMETVGISARLSAADCVRWGCTTVFDHHASPSCIDGSLDVIAGAMEEAGLSAALCYEVTDRNGADQARAGLDENLRFIERCHGNERIRGLLGLHASFTLKDETLERVAELKPVGAGCHIHLAEDPIDGAATREAFGLGPVERLEKFGLLDERCLLAHGIHLGPDEYRAIAGHQATIIHNSESNANNGVGHLDVAATSGYGCLVGLGTDGMSSSMLRALRFAFLIHRGLKGDPSTGFDALPGLLGNNVRVARRFFDEPLLGELAPGAPADIMVVDTAPPTPVEPHNVFGHLVYGATEAPVRHTVARGEVLLRDFRHTTIDPQSLAAEAREVSPNLWRRFHALEWGTSFLGP